MIGFYSGDTPCHRSYLNTATEGASEGESRVQQQRMLNWKYLQDISYLGKLYFISDCFTSGMFHEAFSHVMSFFKFIF